MFPRLPIVCLLLFLAAGFGHAEQKYALKEKVAVGDQRSVEMRMQLTGQLHIKGGEKTVSLKLSASGLHRFPERVMSVDAEGLTSRVARHYAEAKATFTVHDHPTTRTLRPQRRLQVAQRHLGETVTYSPLGPLTRQEVELTGEHLDVLMVGGLLPEKPVAIGETWKVSDAAAQSLAGLDGLSNHELTGKLERINRDDAKITVRGPVNGIDQGAEVKVNVEASLIFDVTSHRILSLEWKQKDARDQGPVGPASETECTTKVKWTHGIPSEHLTNGIIATVPPEPGPAHLLLSHRDGKGRWEFLHDRSWHAVAETEQYAILRLLERGELIGQVNVTPWAKAKPGRHLSPEELRKHIDEAAGFKIDQVLQSGEVPADEGRWIYRLSVVGQSNGLQIMQNYYAVAGPNGEQVVLTFTTEVPQAEKLGERDLAIVGTVTFPPGNAARKSE